MALKKEITEQIKDLLKQNPGGLSITAIVRQIPINRNTAGKYLENLMVSGQVEMRHFGMAKIYSLAQRVPLSAMLSISSELIMLLDTGRRVLYANGAMLDFLGSTQGDLYGKALEYTPCVVVFDDTFDILKRRVQNGVAGKEWSGELVAKNGEIIFSCKIAPAVFEEGQRGVSILLENVTERKSDERRIQESERQFRLLAENTLDIIDRHTPDGICVYVSPAITTISGFQPRELIGKTAAVFVHPDDLPYLERATQELTSANPVVRITYRCRHKDGRYIWAESLFQAVFDDSNGEMIEIYGVTRDITDRILAEQHLRESEDRYRSLVEVSPDAIFLHQDGQVIYMNPAARELLEIPTLPASLSSSILDRIPQESRKTIRDNIQKDLNGEWTGPVEFPFVRKGGSHIILDGRGVRTMVNGRPAVQVTLRDITEQKRAEDALRKSWQQLEDAMGMANLYTWEYDPAAETFLFNDHLFPLFGTTLSREGAYAIPSDAFLRQFVHPGDRNGIVAAVEMALKSADPLYVGRQEARIIRRDGETRNVITLIRALIDPGREAILIRGTLQDVTEQKRAEAAIRESEATARALINAPTDRIILTDNQGKILDINDAAARGLGRTRDEILGKTPSSVLSPGSASARIPRMNDVLTTGKAARFVDERDGIWFDNVIYPVFSPEGEVVRLAIIARDITDQIRAEEALRESENRYRSLSEASQDIIFVISRNDTVEYVNSYAAAMLGIPAETIIGKKRSSFFAGELGERQAQELRRVFATEKAARSEGPIEVSGILRWFDHSLMPITDADGKVTAVLGVSRDITERRQAEEALSESEKRFRDLAEFLPQNVWECDINGKLTFANCRSFDMYRVPPQALDKGLYIWQTIHPDDRDRVMGDFETGKKRPPEEFPTCHEYTALRGDGSTFPVLMYHVPIVRNNRIEGMRGIGIDLSERRQLEDELRETVRSFRNLADRSVDVIARILPDGTCVYVSPAVRRNLGYEPEEITGLRTFDYLHPDDLPHVLSAIRSYENKGDETGTDRFRIRHKDGTYIWFEATIRATRDEETGAIREFTLVNRFAGKADDEGTA